MGNGTKWANWEHRNFSLQLQPPGESALIGLRGRVGAHMRMRNLRAGSVQPGTELWKGEDRQQVPQLPRKDHEQP